MKITNYEFTHNGIEYQASLRITAFGCDVKRLVSYYDEGTEREEDVKDEIQEVLDADFYTEIEKLKEDYNDEIRRQRTSAGKRYLIEE